MLNGVPFYQHTVGCILCNPSDKWHILSHSLYYEISSKLFLFVGSWILLQFSLVCNIWFQHFNCMVCIYPLLKFNLTLAFSSQCVPRISWMFLFPLNAVIGSFLKISLSFWFTCKTFQFLLMVLVIFGRNWLYVITKGILSDFFHVPFSIIRSIEYIYISIYLYIANQEEF